MSSGISGLMPELPLIRVFALKSIIALTTSAVCGLPTLAAWLRSRLA